MPRYQETVRSQVMSDDESPHPSNLGSSARRLLTMASSDPKARARLIELWARAEIWTLVEGIALAWTLDPSTLGREELRRTRPENALPEEARHYLELARRSSALSHQRVTPLRFIEWAHSVGLAFHPDWRQAADQAASEMMQARATESAQRRQQLIRHWARSPYWDAAEGAVLAFDLDPKQTIGRLAGTHDRPRLLAPADAAHLWELALRAIEVGALEDRAAPVKFMTWARTTGTEFHADWWDAVAPDEGHADAEAGPSTSAALPPELKTRERETLLKMVAGMAMAFYGWSPGKLRSASASEIASDLEKFGISLDPDTIRKWLRRGAELIPPQDG